jgi:hypothetical protein
MPNVLRDSLLVLAAALLLTVVATWPLAARFERAGRLDNGDARHGVWNVAWVAHAITSDPDRLWNANIFHPYENALAFSDPNIFSGVLAVPAWFATGNAVAAFNWALMWAFLLAALSMFWLVRYLTGSAAAGTLSALLFTFCPYVFSHLAHIQLLMTFGLPLSLLAMHRVIERPGPGRGMTLGLALAAQGLASGYYGIFAGLAVGLGLLWWGVVDRRWRDARYWAAALLAAAVTALIIAPFIAPFAGIRAEGFGRSLDDARLYGAGWRDYLASPMVIHRWMLPLIATWGEVLFPGLLTVGLALVAIVRAATGRRAAALPLPRHLVGYYLTLAGLALWASLGPEAGLYRLLHDTLPFFPLIRASSRFGVLVTLAMTVLAGVALADLSLSARPVRRRVIVGTLVALAVARSTTGPLSLVDRPDPHAVEERLRQLPRGAVAEFPFYFEAADRHRHTEYMLASTRHWQPLINGYSDHTPPQAFADMPVLARFPDREAWAVLQRRQARYVVIHWGKYEPGASPHDRLRAEAVGRYLRPILDLDDVSLFEIIGWP